jgi:hypothetical protein
VFTTCAGLDRANDELLQQILGFLHIRVTKKDSNKTNTQQRYQRWRCDYVLMQLGAGLDCANDEYLQKVLGFLQTREITTHSSVM